MAKDVIISTSRLNSYGTRIITSGIDIEQYKRNPILLYMHERRNVIGRVENLRFEGDRLIGTPVFDMEDEDAAKIGRKWENGFLNMVSGGFEPVELSNDPQHLLPGQTRSTVMRSVLREVSIADLGSNDDAIKLYEPDGKLLQLAAGVDNDIVPLLTLKKQPGEETPAGEINQDHNQPNLLQMNKILLALGLAATATEDDAVNAITKLQDDAGKAQKIELARIEAAVDAAIKDKKATADKRNTLITLGKTSGFDVLQETIGMLVPARKPNDVITHPGGGTTATPSINLAFSQLSEEQLADLRANNRAEYIRLYKAEFGFVPQIEN